MIKIKALINNWEENYNNDLIAVRIEYKRLRNCVITLWENAIITNEKRDKELEKLSKAYEKYEKLHMED